MAAVLVVQTLYDVKDEVVERFKSSLWSAQLEAESGKQRDVIPRLISFGPPSSFSARSTPSFG